MVVRRHKKVGKYRGSTTHGGGNRKKRRGAGSRGGRGRAGTGKRAGHKKAGMPLQLGTPGFLPRRHHFQDQIINVGNLTAARVEKLLQSGKATKEGALVTINLSALGYTKLLSTGTINLKMKLFVSSWSAKAAEKIAAV